jgi:hypothetical protein
VEAMRLNTRFWRPKRPAVKDYACPFSAFLARRRNARFWRPKRPAVKDYACPFSDARAE